MSNIHTFTWCKGTLKGCCNFIFIFYQLSHLVVKDKIETSYLKILQYKIEVGDQRIYTGENVVYPIYLDKNN